MAGRWCMVLAGLHGDADSPVPIAQRLADLGRERGDGTAVVCGERGIGWADLDRQGNRVARALAARGVRLGDLVTIALPNGVDFVVASAACWKLGAVPQPVSARLPAVELQAIIDLADPPIVLADQVLAVDRPVRDVPALLAESGDDSPLPVRISPSWKAPTSGGSTGRPKLILAGQPGVVTRPSVERWRHEPHGTMVMPGPFYHNGPFISAMNGLFEGSRLIVMGRFDAEGHAAAGRAAPGEWLYLVPTMMAGSRGSPPRCAIGLRRLVAADSVASGRAVPGVAQGGMDRLAGPRDDLGALRRDRGAGPRPSSPGASGWSTAARSAG